MLSSHHHVEQRMNQNEAHTMDEGRRNMKKKIEGKR